MEYALFVLAGFLGATISAVFGFGTGFVVLAVGTFLLPVKEVIALVAVLFAASTTLKTVLFWRQTNWVLVAKMTVVSLPFAWLGASLLIGFPDVWIEKLLGLMVLAYLIVSSLGFKLRGQQTFAWIAIGSAGYGFTSGLLGTGNLIKAIMFREMGLDRQAFVGAMAASSVLATLVKLQVYTSQGLLHSAHILPGIALIIAAVLAVFLGRTLLLNMNAAQFQSGLKILLAISAIALLL